MKSTPSGSRWSDTHIEKAFNLALKTLSPTGGDSAVPPEYDKSDSGEPAKSGTDISNLDTIHKAVLGLGDTLKKMQECQEKYMEMSKSHHANFDDYKQKDYMWSEKNHKALSKLVGQPKEDEKEDMEPNDLEPGDPTHHDPNSNVHDPKMLKELLEALQAIRATQENISKAQKAQSDVIFSLTGEQV